MSKVSHTKITATLGPACSSKEVLGKMFQEGVDMCRLNFSHSNYDEHLRLIRMIRELNDELGTHVAILADLQGPKLRIGEVENNLVTLAEGDVLKLVGENIIGTRERVYMSYQPLPKEVKTGD
jgi:pyruvate kinase